MKVNCIQCNAPLQLLGNSQRCHNLVCEYCGTVMDMRNDFKALYSFSQIQKDSKIRIGQKYTFSNVEFIVIGFITYQTNQSQWIEYQLYSNTHGYAKLIDKDQIIIFLRRTHYLPKPNIWLLTNNKKFTLQNKVFTIEKFEHTEVYYAAGNIIEDISIKKRCKQCFAKSGNTWFQSTYKRNCIEYFIGCKSSL